MREVDTVIAQRLDSGVPLVGSVSQYIISAGGKRLRPALVAAVLRRIGLSGRATIQHGCRGRVHPHRDACCTTMWWTTRTLRRGAPTANDTLRKPGQRAGGRLPVFTRLPDDGRCAKHAHHAGARQMPPTSLPKAKCMQLMNMHNAALDEAGYLQVIRSKTAKLFEASARVGAILSGACRNPRRGMCRVSGQAYGDRIPGHRRRAGLCR